MCRMPVETTREEMASEQNALSPKDSVAYCYTVSDWFKKVQKMKIQFGIMWLDRNMMFTSVKLISKTYIPHCFFLKMRYFICLYVSFILLFWFSQNVCQCTLRQLMSMYKSMEKQCESLTIRSNSQLFGRPTNYYLHGRGVPKTEARPSKKL